MSKFILLPLLLFFQQSFAQSTLPLIHAKSKQIKILDGDYLQDGELVPGLNPDTYVFHTSGKPKKIAYHTDVDSIVFMAKAGESYDFAIVLNNKDTCYQRVTTNNPGKVIYRSKNEEKKQNDTIAFVLGPNNAIHINGRINNSEMLDLIFDTGASIGVLSDQGAAKKAKQQDDGNNRFEISGIVIDHSPVKFIDYNGRLKADGVLGYNAFEGRIVEINYDKNILIIHHHLPETKTYSSTNMVWRGSAMFIEGQLGTGNKMYPGFFLFDTGSKWALSLTKAYATENELYGLMKEKGTRRAKGANGKTVRSITVILPELILAGHRLLNVPIDLEKTSEAKGNLDFNILGNDVLKRFNVILDYKNGAVYLQTNKLVNEPYTKSFYEKDMVMIAVAIVILIATIFFIYRSRKRKKSVK